MLKSVRLPSFKYFASIKVISFILYCFALIFIMLFPLSLDGYYSSPENVSREKAGYVSIDYEPSEFNALLHRLFPDESFTQKPVSVFLTLERLSDFRPESGSIYVAGDIDLVWSKDSFPRNIKREHDFGFKPDLKLLSSDLSQDIILPGLRKNSDFYFQEVGKSSAPDGVTARRLSFGGTLDFDPSFESYPFDKQSITISQTFKSLKVADFSFLPQEPLIALSTRGTMGRYRLMENYNYFARLIVPSENDEIDGQIKDLVTDFSKWNKNDADVRLRDIDKKLCDIIPSSSPSLSNFSYPCLFNWLSMSRYESGFTIEFRGTPVQFVLRTLLPIELVLMVGVLSTFVSRKFADVRLAIPPTILLSLVFMQQSNVSDLPQSIYASYIDIVYYFAYLSAILLFVEAAVSTRVQHSSSSLLVTRATRFCVIMVVLLVTKVIFQLMK